VAGDVQTGRTSPDLRDLLAERLGSDVGLDTSSDPDTLDVPSDGWHRALTALRDEAALDYFDWLSAVDLDGDGFQVVVHLAHVGRPDDLAHVLVRTSLPADDPRLDSVTDVFRGASWHERETHEMFGIDFLGHPNLVPLLLPDGFEGHPLRKDFVLVARAAKPWPGAKEPGESDAEAAPSRRRLLPPGVPDPSWGAKPVREPDAQP